MNNIAIEVKNITKTFKMDKPKGIIGIIKTRKNPELYKNFNALEDVSFSVKKGEVMGIIGLNGSGKTTLLRTIAGVYKPDKGYVKITGRLSPLMQIGAGFHNDLNAQDNIIANGLLLGATKSFIESKVDEIIKYAELEKFQKLQLRHYSSGMKSRLGFAITRQINPDILLVDEILSVGDKNFRKKSLESFYDMKKANKTILHSTHNLKILSDISDKILLLHKGRMVLFGKPDEAIKKYEEIKPTK